MSMVKGVLKELLEVKKRTIGEEELWAMFKKNRRSLKAESFAKERLIRMCSKIGIECNSRMTRAKAFEAILGRLGDIYKTMRKQGGRLAFCRNKHKIGKISEDVNSPNNIQSSCINYETSVFNFNEYGPFHVDVKPYIDAMTINAFDAEVALKAIEVYDINIDDIVDNITGNDGIMSLKNTIYNKIYANISATTNDSTVTDDSIKEHLAQIHANLSEIITRFLVSQTLCTCAIMTMLHDAEEEEEKEFYEKTKFPYMEVSAIKYVTYESALDYFMMLLTDAVTLKGGTKTKKRSLRKPRNYVGGNIGLDKLKSIFSLDRLKVAFKKKFGSKVGVSTTTPVQPIMPIAQPFIQPQNDITITGMVNVVNDNIVNPTNINFTSPVNHIIQGSEEPLCLYISMMTCLFTSPTILKKIKAFINIDYLNNIDTVLDDYSALINKQNNAINNRDHTLKTILARIYLNYNREEFSSKIATIYEIPANSTTNAIKNIEKYNSILSQPVRMTDVLNVLSKLYPGQIPSADDVANGGKATMIDAMRFALTLLGLIGVEPVLLFNEYTENTENKITFIIDNDLIAQLNDLKNNNIIINCNYIFYMVICGKQLDISLKFIKVDVDKSFNLSVNIKNKPINLITESISFGNNIIGDISKTGHQIAAFKAGEKECIYNSHESIVMGKLLPCGPYPINWRDLIRESIYVDPFGLCDYNRTSKQNYLEYRLNYHVNQTSFMSYNTYSISTESQIELPGSTQGNATSTNAINTFKNKNESPLKFVQALKQLKQPKIGTNYAYIPFPSGKRHESLSAPLEGYKYTFANNTIKVKDGDIVNYIASLYDFDADNKKYYLIKHKEAFEYKIDEISPVAPIFWSDSYELTAPAASVPFYIVECVKYVIDMLDKRKNKEERTMYVNGPDVRDMYTTVSGNLEKILKLYGLTSPKELKLGIEDPQAYWNDMTIFIVGLCAHQYIDKEKLNKKDEIITNVTKLVLSHIGKVFALHVLDDKTIQLINQAEYQAFPFDDENEKDAHKKQCIKNAVSLNVTSGISNIVMRNIINKRFENLNKPKPNSPVLGANGATSSSGGAKKIKKTAKAANVKPVTKPAVKPVTKAPKKRVA